ncbi:S1C family serine protease [Sediminibacillus albus]|uniref:Trypsin-like peptidase domain-containing protein n=1 Tax=Sediminibacillus albus TaxID=407036 RepID=A0A1G9CB22_9BACI|nr:serine protease [Sediminibacillus albus]SDK48829.1 Trypsin-like peptidase domain-containing protein [Sediminibacillus albus]
MNKSDEEKHDIIDEDLYEDIPEEELLEILDEEKRKAIKAQADKEAKPKRPFPKWAFWLIAVAMMINVIALLPNTVSVPAVNFLITSAKLSQDDQVSAYKQSVVVIEAGDSRGTGFSISADGKILTNHHVIEDERRILAAYPEDGLFDAEVIASYPDIDLAVLQVKAEGLPYLDLANDSDFTAREHIHFIGNPLRFQGIANEGEIIGYTELDSWDQQVMMLEAPVYRGNSGSPVINSEGAVIGVVFATLDHEGHGKVGLAVPIDYFHEKQSNHET